MKTIKLIDKNYRKAIETSVAFLKAGETIIIPTDTIYGLACDATSEKAIEKLLKIKERDRQKGLPIFINSIEMARRLAYIDKKKEEFLRKVWFTPLEVKLDTLFNDEERRMSASPYNLTAKKDVVGLLTGPGKVTVVLHAKDSIPRLATGGKETIALRMPDYKFITDLITAFGKPITGTSANISGNESIRSATDAATQWKNKKTAPALIIDGGEIINTEPSTIVDITGASPIILRSGIISKKELKKLFSINY